MNETILLMLQQQELFYKLLYDESPLEFVFYDMSSISSEFKQASCQKESTVLFKDFCAGYFKQYHSYMYPEHKVGTMLESHIIALFNVFLNNCFRRFKNNKEEVDEWAYVWISHTKFIIEEIFARTHHSESRSGEKKDNLSLVITIINTLNGALSDYVRYREKEMWPDELSQVPYKLENMEEKRNEIISFSYFRPSRERAIVDHALNEAYFVLYFTKYLNNIESSSKDIHQLSHADAAALTYIEELFCDFTYRTRVVGSYCADHLCFIVKYWKDLTKNLIQTVVARSIYSIILPYVAPDHIDIRMNVPITSKASNAITSINNFWYKCIGFIDAICEEYVSQVQTGCLEMPWSESLESMGINYEGLYDDMKGVYLPEFITYTEFKNAFKYADFGKLHEEAKSSKQSGGCILFMINKLKEHKIDNEWVIHASKSIYPNKENPYRTLQANADPGEKKSRFEDVLVRHIAVFKKKSRR